MVGDAIANLQGQPSARTGTSQRGYLDPTKSPVDFSANEKYITGPPVVQGFTRAMQKGVSSFLTPNSLAMLTSTFGASALPYIGKAVSLGFIADTLKNSAPLIPVLKEQIDRKDVAGATETLTTMGISAAMAAMMVKHIVKPIAEPPVGNVVDQAKRLKMYGDEEASPYYFRKPRPGEDVPPRDGSPPPPPAAPAPPVKRAAKKAKKPAEQEYTITGKPTGEPPKPVKPKATPPPVEEDYSIDADEGCGQGRTRKGKGRGSGAKRQPRMGKAGAGGRE